VSGAYDELDRDRRRTDRSMSLMIEEIDAVQRNLERLVIERTEELRAREARFASAEHALGRGLSNMSQGLVMFDGEGRLVICNGVTSRCIGSSLTMSARECRCAT
jgi:PAS domain-containing protein